MRKVTLILSLMVLGVLLLGACASPAEPVVEEADAPDQASAEGTPIEDLMTDPSLPYQYNADDLPETFGEAPMLAEQVADGSLPPVEERLPANPPVVVPVESVGQYGGHVRAHLWDLSFWWLSARHLAHADLIRQQRGNSGQFEPDLAERWEVSEDSTEWTFYLREGLKWSDGEPFTTEDIMFWYENMLLNDSLMPAKPAWLTPGDEIVQMEAVDDLTLRLTFAESHPLFLLGLTQGNSHGWTEWTNHPQHYMMEFHPNFVSEEELNAKVEAAGLGSWVDLFRRETEPHTASEGRPYLWAWTPDAPMGADGSWSWSRNPYYYKIDEEGNQLPYIDTWSHTKVTDNQAIILNTVAGEFDLVETWIRGDSIPTIRDAIDSGTAMRIIPNLNAKTGEVSIYINYTVDDPVLREIFNDIRFRQAVSLGINREEVSEARFRGFSTPGQASYPPIDPFVYDEEWHTAFIEYDPERANELLDEMGLTERDSEDYRLRPDGERLTILMDYQSGNHTQAIELLPDYMQAIGIELQLEPSASALYLERTIDNSVQWAGWSMQPSFYSPSALLPGGAESATHHPFGVLWSRWYYSNGEQGEEPPEDMRQVMELVDAAEQASSIEERAELISQAGELHKENLWVIGIAGMDLRPHVAHENLRNIPATPYGLNTDPASHSEYTETWFWDE